MNLAVFKLFPCLWRAKQNKIKGMKETSRCNVSCKHSEIDYSSES